MSGANRALVASDHAAYGVDGPSGFDHGYLEALVHDLWRDARALAVAPMSDLATHEHDIIEARKCLNDALAKIERRRELAA